MIFSGSVRKANTVAGGAAIWFSCRTMSCSVIEVSLLGVAMAARGAARNYGNTDASTMPGSRRHRRGQRFWKRPKAHGHQERTEAHAPGADIEPRVARKGVVDQAAGDRSRGHAETAR